MRKVKKLDAALADPDAAVWVGLEHQRLTEVPKELRRLTRVRKLSLFGNKLETLPSWLAELPIKKLNLGNNPMRSLPEVIGAMPVLEELWLRWMPDLEIVGPELGGLSQLKRLVLTDCPKLEQLPEAMTRLTSLEVLSLSALRQLQKCPEISAFSELRELWIEAWPLATLPEGTCQLRRLRKIAAGLARIESLPDDFGALSALRDLDLARTLLRGLPASFGKLAKLEQLALHATKLESIPSSFVELAALKVLGMYGGALPEPSTTLAQLASLPSLRELSFFAGPRERRPLDVSGALFRASSLESLYFSGFDVRLPSRVDDAAGSALRSITLPNAAIDALPSWFAELPRLESLDVDGNPLSGLPEKLVESPSLRSLTIIRTAVRVPQRAGLEVFSDATLEELKSRVSPKKRPKKSRRS